MSAHLLTGEAVPVAPFAGAGVLGLLTLAAFLAFLVCLGLREAWGHTIGYGLRWIADQIENVTIDFGVYSVSPFGFVADVFRSVDHVVAHALAVAALNTESSAAAMWHLTAQVFWWSVHETKSLSIDTFHALEHMFTVTVPDAAKWARREAVTVAHRIVNVEAAARRAADTEIRQVAHTAEADALHGLRTAEHALDWSETQVGHIGREIDALKARVGGIARQLTPAAIVGLIGATIFTEFGLGWLRCSNVGKAGKRLCGLGIDAIDALLLGTLAVEGSVSLVSMAHELVDLSDEFVPVIIGFVSELSGVTFRTAAEQGFG